MKEAYLKAYGIGIINGINQYYVPCVSVNGNSKFCGWYFFLKQPKKNYFAAVCARTKIMDYNEVSISEVNRYYNIRGGKNEI